MSLEGGYHFAAKKTYAAKKAMPPKLCPLVYATKVNYVANEKIPAIAKNSAAYFCCLIENTLPIMPIIYAA